MVLNGQGKVVGGYFVSAVAAFGALQLTNINTGASGFSSDDIFLARLNRLGTWAPTLRTGGVLVRDNLAVHKIGGLREWLTERGGADVVFITLLTH